MEHKVKLLTKFLIFIFLLSSSCFANDKCLLLLEGFLTKKAKRERKIINEFTSKSSRKWKRINSVNHEFEIEDEQIANILVNSSDLVVKYEPKRGYLYKRQVLFFEKFRPGTTEYGKRLRTERYLYLSHNDHILLENIFQIQS